MLGKLSRKHFNIIITRGLRVQQRECFVVDAPIYIFSLLSIAEKPVFARKPSDATVKVGGSVQFRCEARGDPMPAVRWSKEHGQLPSGR